MATPSSPFSQRRWRVFPLLGAMFCLALLLLIPASSTVLFVGGCGVGTVDCSGGQCKGSDGNCYGCSAGAKCTTRPSGNCSAPKGGVYCCTAETLQGGLTPAGDVSGTWEGSGTFQNNAANPACQWNGRLNPPAVVLALQQQGSTVAGTITLNIPLADTVDLNPGDSFRCDQPLVGTGPVVDGVISSSSLTFKDSGGNFWQLSLTSDTLGGKVTNSTAPAGNGLQTASPGISLSRKR